MSALGDKLAEYTSAREALQKARGALRETERELLAVQSKLREQLSAEQRAQRRFVEIAGEIPRLLHADVSGVVGRAAPEVASETAPPRGD